jgi:chitin disaccharide deacetylase
MASPDSVRRLIVNADDFGRSKSINEAVIRAHHEGILTSASLMVNEPGFDEAVELAKENPRLGVGLHLTLLCGKAACAPGELPDLVDSDGEFPRNPIRVGLKYFFRRSLEAQLTVEIASQFTKFRKTGLELDHLNGHLHMHLHPAIFKILSHRCWDFGFQRMRLTRDNFFLSRRIASGRWCYRASHAIIYEILSRRAREPMRQRGIKYAQFSFGLLQDSCVDEEFILKLLPFLPPGDSELYSHPSLDKFKHEFDALVSPRVKALVEKLGIQLVRYQDL